MNIENILKEGIKILQKNKIANPQLDSEILLSNSIKRDKKHIILNPKEVLNSEQLGKFKSLIERRKKGEPIAYLINKKEFWKDEFFVNKDVLIPRPDSELIIEQVLKINSKDNQLQILDIGTGSGCILLSILKERSNFYGTGIDISKKSINVSKFNAKQLHLTNRVKFFHSSVDNFNNGKYDIIVSNPPYIEQLSLKYLEKDVVNFEPKLALSGGFDGFSKIRKVINKASILIKKNGKFILEIGFNQKNKVIKILKEEGFYVNKAIKDYGNNDRCIISTKI
ncbi:peptide chain release factor N(5)-glutamine methyltransferase [Candidatus Pelagibacter ubique]|jgi:release factor glutamine methyltransferase|uniref:peptide chain release factor N(5)-glutamine methyltransferase n=1 Tax=Pelagibacter ubique TaxID=198252 RepID=UPI00036F1D43|nr:peptide chain release factor N(5)-glutamine methyltransferase [Candidatus Pelagibacter ubique]MDA9972660.1 peptide chain release factor N(5)-glutamine methyltransferase [Candidatus Pelagibacter ubique]MDB0029232.1 peptide chain release factor N(5)-glutamine methyltransferase [Candidatus Pelagibacter ubique]MDB3968541.1 peptide chain release factor N(5)-glutamine methyltransferase [Candidatus Pelagibacter ubique]MDB9714170.1 peptide chain release factor N(5)-glutamine methyltransferase [Candi